MTLENLIKIYENKKKKHGEQAYKFISQVFDEAKQMHEKSALQRGIRDTEQSWRAFKGKNLEKLIEYILADIVRDLGLEIKNGNQLEKSKNLPPHLEQIKRNLCVDFGEFGMHLPDVDMVIFDPKKHKIIAVLSSKVTLRERIAQTGYWKLKLLQSSITRHIKVFFITLDEDGTLCVKKPAKKGRAICETDTDGCYILTNAAVETSAKIKLFAEFINDLQKIYRQ